MEDLDKLEMRHLRYFLAVARTGNMSLASQQLNITQPSLSQMIKKLEHTVGLELFTRHPRGVELTPEGKSFHRGVERLFEGFSRVLSETRGKPAEVQIGVCADVMPDLLARVENALANCSSLGSWTTPTDGLFRPVSSSQQISQLSTGELQLGIVRLPMDEPEITVALLSDEPIGVVTHVRHPLASSAGLTWRDLDQQQLLWFDNHRAPGYAEELLSQLRTRGWNPELHILDNNRRSLFAHTLQSVHNLVALRPQSSVENDPQLTWHALSNAPVPHERIGLVARRDCEYAATLYELAAENGWPVNST